MPCPWEVPQGDQQLEVEKYAPLATGYAAKLASPTMDSREVDLSGSVSSDSPDPSAGGGTRARTSVGRHPGRLHIRIDVRSPR